jgi:hypothetical protein
MQIGLGLLLLLTVITGYRGFLHRHSLPRGAKSTRSSADDGRLTRR